MKILSLLSGSGLRARSLRATGLTLIRFGGSKALQLVSNLILTRLLFPEAFGLMTLVTVFVVGLNLISDVGIKPSVIRSKRSEEPIFQSTAWTLQVARGGFITLAAWLLAWPYAWVYDEPILFWLIALASFSAAIKGFGSIEMMLNERRMALGRLVAMQLSAQILSMLITISLAFWMQSVWALAIGFVVAALLSTGFGLWQFPSANHRFSWDSEVLSEILVYGRWILLGTLFTYFGGHGISAVQGALVDLDTLAFLAIAGQFGLMITEVLGAVLSSVLFPMLSQLHRENPAALAPTMLRVRRLLLLASFPGFILLSFIAQPLIDLLYDTRYAPAGGYLSLLALNAALGVIPMAYQNTFLAIGDSRLHSIVMGVAAVLRIGCTVIGFLLGGVMGMIIGLAVATVLTNLLSLTFATRAGFGAPLTDAIATTLITAIYIVQLTSIL